MNITFLDAAGVVQFVRDDYESGSWRQQEFTVNLTFPFVPDKIIERGMRLSFPNPANGVQQFFEIRNVQNIEPDAYQQIIAEHIVVSELSDEHLQGVEISEKTALQALTTALTGTLWQPGNSSVNGTENADFSRGSVWQSIAVIQSNWNCHIIPRIEIDGDGSITGRYLDIVPAEGTFRGLRLSIYRNMSDSTVTYDDTECLTALYGYGGSVDVPQSGGQPDKTEELTFKDVVWSATSAHPAKPSGQLYLEDPAKTALYGRNGRARYGYYQNSDIKDAEILLAKTWEALKATSQPKISITGTVADLKRLGFPDVSPELWDKVIVDVIDTGETFVKQIIQNDVDLCDPSATVPTIGDYIPNIIYINRETNERASGRGGGGSRGQTNIQHEDGEYFSEFRKTTDMVALVVGTYNGGYKIDAGRIALAINEDGSNAFIEANHVIVNGDTVLTTALEEIRSEVWAADSSAHSAIVQTASHIMSEVVSSNNAIYSRITQTASQIRAEVAAVDSGLSSAIIQTASAIRSEVTDKANSLESSIMQTASQIRTEVSDKTNSLSSSITQTAAQIRAEVNAQNSAVYSSIRQTASQIRAEVASTDSNLRSIILQTSSAIMLQVGKKAQVFHQFSDPALTEDVAEGDFWVMDSGVRTYGQAGGDTWNTLSAYTWGDFFGSIIYVRDGNEWVQVGGDQLAEITNGKVEVTDEYIRMWKESGVDFAGISIEQDRIMARVASVEQGLTSVIEQTASMIRTAVFTANSEMYSEILQTQSMIQSTVANSESNVMSQLVQTASNIQINVNKKSAVYFQMTDPTQDSPPVTPNTNDVWIKSNKLNTYGQAGLKTWSELGAYTWMDYYGSQMYAWDGQQWQPISDAQKANYNYTLLQQTETALTSVKGDLSGAYSLISQTKSEIKSIVNDRVNGLQSSITQTASQIRLEVTDKINSVSSSITQTASEIRAEVNTANSQIYSSISQTASQIRAEVTDKTNSISSSITQTASAIRAEVNTANSQIYSTITQTASQIRTEVTNKTNSISSSLTQTASAIRSEVNTANSQIYTAIQQTASQIRTEVTNKTSSLQSSITQQADRISLVVQGTGSSATIKAAQIVTSINNSGSSVMLDANRIRIGNDSLFSPLATGVQCNKPFTANSGLYVIVSTSGGGSAGIDVRNSIVTATESNGVLTLKNMSQSTVIEYAPVDSGTIKSATVSGSTLTLTNYAGSTINFSKATALSSSWVGSNNGTLRVDANQTNGGTTTRVARLETAISARLAGTAAASNFSAQYGTSEQSGFVPHGASVYGYLILSLNGSNSYVDVNTKSDGTGTTVARLGVSSVYNAVAVSGITATSVDPSYSTESNGNNITVSLSNGKTSTQAITLTKGNWSSGHIAVNSYLGDSSGTRFNRVWVTVPDASGFNKNVTSYNTSGSNLVGSISKSGLTANSYIYWTVGGKKFHIVVNA